MLKLGGLARGDMQQCLKELDESTIPHDFKLRQVRCLMRFLREAGGFVDHIRRDSGFEGDTTSYLEILCAKEDTDLIRRVSHTRVLRQDYDEKRCDWRKQKQSVINAIGMMTARALRFEDKERKTIALYALEYYKNIMANKDGAILGESESTDSLVEQYRRHRNEIAKIPTYADSILKMLKDIRKTVRASTKLQRGSTVFAQFLDEWWASVVQFLQQSSIVDAEKNAREVMQTLRKLKGKQEENKKREMSRLLCKLDEHAGMGPPAGRLSELLMPPSQEDLKGTFEDTGHWDNQRPDLTPRMAFGHGLKRDRDSNSSSEPEVVSPSAVEDTHEFSPLRFTAHHQHQQHHQQQRQTSISSNDVQLCEVASSASSSSRRSTVRSTGAGLGCAGRNRVSTMLSMREDSEENSHSVTCSLQSPTRLRSQHSSSKSIFGVASSTVSWDEVSVGTVGTMEVADLPATSGLPDSDDEADEEDDDDLFEAANDLDLGAIDLRQAEHQGEDGHVSYHDQEDLGLSSSVAQPSKKQEKEQKRFSAALDFFRQEQQIIAKRSAIPPRPPSPVRSTSFKLPSPISSAAANNAFGRKMGGTPRVRTGVAISRIVNKTVKKRVSAERNPITTPRSILPMESSGRGKGFARSLSVYLPRSHNSTTPRQNSSRTPTLKSSRRAAPAPGLVSTRAKPRGAFFA